jgi:hypothetical protein
MPTSDDLIKETDRLLALKFEPGNQTDITRVGSECFQGTMTLLNAVYGPGSAKENYLVTIATPASSGPRPPRLPPPTYVEDARVS